jgi:hypothetical protein
MITYEISLREDGNVRVYILFSIVLFNLVRHRALDRVL